MKKTRSCCSGDFQSAFLSHPVLIAVHSFRLGVAPSGDKSLFFSLLKIAHVSPVVFSLSLGDIKDGICSRVRKIISRLLLSRISHFNSVGGIVFPCSLLSFLLEQSGETQRNTRAATLGVQR
jgi:hypothetical protein